MIPALPAELVDIVIDHLFDDKPSLRACSLVSSTWLPTSRYHLFRSITVYIKQGILFADFLNFLRSTHLGLLVRDLTLSGVKATRYRQDRLSHPLLLHILDRLPFLRSFRLRQVSFYQNPESWSPEDRLRLRTGPTSLSLDHLQFEYIGRPAEVGSETSAWEVFGVCSSFTSFRTLHLSDLDFRTGSRPWLHPQLPCIVRPTVLRIDNCVALRILVKNLARYQVLSSVEELHIVSEDYRPVGKILQEAGTRLRRLTLDMGTLETLRHYIFFVNPGENLLNLVDLAHCTSLVDLTLRLHVVRTIHSITTVGMPWEPFRAFFPRLSPTIQNVTVDIRSGPLLGAQRFLHDTETERWSGIEDRVDRLVSLKSLKFDFHHVPDAKPSLHMTPETFATQLEHILVHKLPRLKALRKLSFSNVVILDSVSIRSHPSVPNLDTIPQ